MTLTPRRRAILMLFADRRSAGLPPPNYPEIAVAVGLRTRAGVWRQCLALHAAGYLRRRFYGGRQRGYALVGA